MDYLEQLIQARRESIRFLSSISNEYAIEIPRGASNNILWHAGHLYVTLEKLAFQCVDLPIIMPDNFPLLFAKGTSPSEWDTLDIPNLAIVINLLKQQCKRLTSIFVKSDEESKIKIHTETGFHLENQKSLLIYALYHEGIHLGQMKIINKLL